MFQNAAIDIRENKLSIRKGAEKHGINRMTIKRYFKKVVKKGTDNATIGLFLHRKIFTTTMESDLALHLIDLCNQLYGLTSSTVKMLAWKYAIKNSIKTPKSWITEQMAGKKWLLEFVHCHNLSLRVSEATSTPRATTR